MPVSQELRDLIVKNYSKGRSVRKIAQLLILPKSTVHNIVRRYVQKGEMHTRYNGSCGRSRRLTERDEWCLSRASVANPLATARQLRASVGEQATIATLSTIKRALRRQRRIAYRPRKSPSLSRAQQIARLRWCQQYSAWSVEDWKKVSFIILCKYVSLLSNVNVVPLFRSFSPMKLT